MFDFGLRLRALRKRHNLTQAGLSRKLNISKSSICKYEKNEMMPSLDILVRLSVLYKVTLDYLTGIEDHQTLVMDDLTDQQCFLLQSLCSEFRAKSTSVSCVGLTPTQLQLLNDIIIEFSSR